MMFNLQPHTLFLYAVCLSKRPGYVFYVVLWLAYYYEARFFVLSGILYFGILFWSFIPIYI